MRRLIDASPAEREDRIHAICAAAASDAERVALYWQFCQAEVAELNQLGARIELPSTPPGTYYR